MTSVSLCQSFFCLEDLRPRRRLQHLPSSSQQGNTPSCSLLGCLPPSSALTSTPFTRLPRCRHSSSSQPSPFLVPLSVDESAGHIPLHDVLPAPPCYCHGALLHHVAFFPRAGATLSLTMAGFFTGCRRAPSRNPPIFMAQPLPCSSLLPATTRSHIFFVLRACQGSHRSSRPTPHLWLSLHAGLGPGPCELLLAVGQNPRTCALSCHPSWLHLHMSSSLPRHPPW
jgi:hypothetical protein